MVGGGQLGYSRVNRYSCDSVWVSPQCLARSRCQPPGPAHNDNNDRILKAYLNATWRNLCIASLHVNCFHNHFHVQLVRADLDLFGCPRFLMGVGGSVLVRFPEISLSGLT